MDLTEMSHTCPRWIFTKVDPSSYIKKNQLLCRIGNLILNLYKILQKNLAATGSVFLFLYILDNSAKFYINLTAAQDSKKSENRIQ